MNQKITFITALIRPENLVRLEQSLFEILSDNVVWSWVVVVDEKFVTDRTLIPPVHATVLFNRNPVRSYGFLEKNVALDLIREDTWIYFLDDDTELHPDFATLFQETMANQPFANLLVFGQELVDGSIRTPQAGLNDYLGRIDMCQYMAKRIAIGDIRFTAQYGADGEFFNAIYSKHRSTAVFRTEAGFLHNSLRKEPWQGINGHGRPY